MQNSCDLSVMRKCLKNNFSPCNCEKCKKRKSEETAGQESYAGSVNAKYCDATIVRDFSLWNNTFETDKVIQNVRSLENVSTQNDKCTFKRFTSKLKSGSPKFGFTALNLSSFLFDIVGIIAFFIMASLIFWITISIHLCRLIIMIYKSGRKYQIISLVLLALLCLCLTFHVVKERQKSSTSSTPAKLQLPDLKATENDKQHSEKSCDSPVKKDSKPISQTSKYNQFISSLKGKICKDCCKCNGSKFKKSKSVQTSPNSCQSKISPTPSLCDLCSKISKNKKLNSEPIHSDEEAREMLKKSKLYAIPTEMKSPPSSLVYLVEYLKNFFYRTS